MLYSMNVCDLNKCCFSHNPSTRLHTEALGERDMAEDDATPTLDYKSRGRHANTPGT